MATPAAEQRNLLKETSGEPLRLLDPETYQEYILLPAGVYEQLRSVLTDLHPRGFYPALERPSATKAGTVRRWMSSTAMVNRGQIVVVGFVVACRG